MHSKQRRFLSIGLLCFILFLMVEIMEGVTNQKEQVVFEDLKIELEDSQHILAKDSDSLLLALHDAILVRPDDEPIAETVKYIQTISNGLINDINKDNVIPKEKVIALWKDLQAKCLDTIVELSKKYFIISKVEIEMLKETMQKNFLIPSYENTDLQKVILKSVVLQNSVICQNYLADKVGVTVTCCFGELMPVMTHLSDIPLCQSINSEVFLSDIFCESYPKFLWQEVNGKPVTLKKEYDYYKYQTLLTKTGEPTFEIKHYWENRSVVNHQWQIDTIFVQDTFKFYVR